MNEQSNPTSLTPLAIIGMGALFPKAGSLETYWSNIKRGVDAITEVPESHWRPEDYFSGDQKKPDFTYGRRGGFLEPFDFDPLKYGIPPNVIEATDTSQLLGLVAAEMAMQNAGYGMDREFDRDRVSVILGVTGALELVVPLGARLGHPIWRRALKDAGIPAEVAEDAVQRIADGYVSWQENSFPGLLGNVVAGRISKYLNTGATNCVVDAACASSLSALHLASLELSTGKIDMAITGGVDTFNDIFMYMCFSKTPALSPTGNSKPFDKDGDGTILGEGIGMLVIKRLADAERDGDTIYAVIKAIGSSSDGKGDAIYAPSSPGQMKALRDAYRRADIEPRTIELLEAHGTGTSKGDAVEVRALREVFGSANGEGAWCALGSVKSQIGHTKAAAGSAGLIKAALALHHKVLPPTLKVNEPLEVLNDADSPFYVNTTPRPWVGNADYPRRAGVSSFGFGGSNFHAVLEEYTPKKAAPDSGGTVQIIALSAPGLDGLRLQLQELPDGGDWIRVRETARRTRGAFEANAGYRLVLVIEEGGKSLGEVAKNAIELLDKHKNAAAWSSPDGIYYGAGPAVGSLALVFPGQGAQYTGMLRDLACEFPEMLETIDCANRTLADDFSLVNAVYPHPRFNKRDAEADEDRLRATDVAQPAIGAVSLGAARVLARFGVLPQAVAGHSYGELTALCAAGVFDETDFARLSRLRGALMGSGEGDKGAMLAVRAPLADIEAVIADAQLDVVVANKNAPDQSVLSGNTKAIAAAHEAFKSRKMTCAKLQVAAAFHSALVAGAAKPFFEALNGVDCSAPAVPVYSNTTGRIYPSEPAALRSLLANQLANPVEFVHEIESLYHDGVRTFVEAGPGARMTGLVKSILGDRAHSAVALDPSNGKKSGIADLAKMLAQLAAEGRSVSLERWDDQFVPAAPSNGKKRMTVPLTGANYRTPRPARPASVPMKPAGAPAQPAASTPAPGPAIAPPAPITFSGGSAALFEQTQANITALQQMQEQTARLHQQFLAGQEQAARTFQMILEQQRGMIFGGAMVVPSTADLTSAAPAPTLQSAEIQPSAAAPPTAVRTDRLTPTLLEVVAEKTGYPVDMLELSMSLDADLGIDSIKRVEILSAMQERIPGLPSIDADELGAIQTLQDIVDRFGPISLSEAILIPAANSAGTAAAELQKTLMEVISEKTGYPVDMLDLSMSLDADLGIDSIKRVEILSATQERIPGLPAIEAEALGQLQTLQDVVDHLSATSVPPVPTPSAAGIDLTALLLEIVSEKTGYPTGMLELSMSLDADLGIDSIKRVEILSAMQDRAPALPSIDAEALGQLQTLGDVVAALGSAPNIVAPPLHPRTSIPPAMSSGAPMRLIVRVVPAPSNRPSQPLRIGGRAAVVCDREDILARSLIAELEARGLSAVAVAPGANCGAPLDALIVVSPLNTDDAFIKQSFASAQRAAAALRQSKHAVFATVSRLGGGFGFEQLAEGANALTGALAGLAKTASYEWPEVRCRAIDISDAVEASAIMDELELSGQVEVGLSANATVTLELVETNAPASVSSIFDASDVIAVSGGARGVTAEVVHAIAAASKASFLLFGRSEEPKAEADWLAGSETEAQIKQAIIANAAERLSPREVGDRCADIRALREVRANLDRIRSAGSNVRYVCADVTGSGAIDAAIQEASRELGPITGIIHGAGVLADRLIEDKSPEQFDRVYDTKVLGLRALLNAASGPLKAIVLFSSSTGRFGRKGQSDYAIANEVLNKTAQIEARRRPNTRVVAVNWGPWDGGMVTPELRKIFAAEGIGMIGLCAGSDYLLGELAASGGPAEVVVLGPGSPTPRSGTAQAAPAIEIPVSVDRCGFLASHVLDGKAVLPVAMYVEWFAHAALHENPGLRFAGLENLRVFKGVVLEPGETRLLQFSAGRAAKDSNGLYRAKLEMRSGSALHAAAEILLSQALLKAPESPAAACPSQGQFPDGAWYESGRLFHGPELRGIDRVDGCDTSGIQTRARTAPRTPDWIADPLRKSWIADPLVLDCAFQTMILWSQQRFGAGSLPVRIGRYSQYVNSFPKGHITIRAAVSEASEHKAIARIDFINPKTGALIARMDDYECVIDASLNAAFQRSALTFAK